MKRSVPYLGLLAALVAAAAAAVVASGFFLVGTCGVSDVADSFPADASPQGWVCGADADEWYQVPGVLALLLGIPLSVALLALVWRRTSDAAPRVVSCLLLVLVPAAISGVLTLPGDECSAVARRSHIPEDCWTTPDG